MEKGNEKANAARVAAEAKAVQANRDKWADPKDFPEENCSKEQFVQDADKMDIGREVAQILQISTHFLEALEKSLVCFALVSVRPSAVWNMG